MNAPLVVSIGTSHPWNIAGTGLDVLVGMEFDVRVTSVIVAISAQDSGGIRALEAVSRDAVRAQLGVLPWRDVGAIRVGALTTAENVRAVAKSLEANPDVFAVVDPVLGATRGGVFSDESTVRAIRERIATLPNVILTPNLSEAAALLDVATVTHADQSDAAETLRAFGSHAVLVTGGHLAGDPVDVLAHAGGIESFTAARIGVDMRGTGCVLAMALACELARGTALLAATARARAFVRSKIAGARQFQGLRVAY